MSTTTPVPPPPGAPAADDRQARTDALKKEPKHITALRRFAMSITALNIVGYAFLGFEQPWTWPIIAVLTAYVIEIGLERVGAWQEGRDPRYAGGGAKGLMEFLFPAHITALAINMLSYPLDHLGTMIFAVAIGVGAKWVLRAPVKGRLRHFMNPSNLGIATILVLFPWASIAPPYQFTEALSGWADWILPVAILTLGTMLNAKLTGRTWLIVGWLSFFVIQSVARWLIVGNALPGALATMTGTAFILFTNYMISDPGTTPSKPFPQFAFGAGVAVVYGFYTGSNLPYGLFFATATVCAIRGAFLWGLYLRDKYGAGLHAEPLSTVTSLPTPGPDRTERAARAA
ncbi:enediyne biosynthesis protein [Actinomycetospora atypica]|uniref:Enediyne biosynthesis protein n=1 Tax=Actinomycetospora atypica TaxID=1290095 RepID=A0ABV9YS21_9PSEU